MQKLTQQHLSFIAGAGSISFGNTVNNGYIVIFN